MARYEHLPIFKKAMELSIYLDTTVRNFSRYHKYTLGSDLRNSSMEIIRLIVRANSHHDKRGPLRDLVEQCEMLSV